ncbi:flagellar hook assembly protein FlgD [Brevibacillus sp. H7]|uniref:flagellar hook assembly protein FlgD n=1 Tax=Brevibacillus sp. H7 TaxID=3349138 RepID=UPI0037FB8E54
MASSVNNTNSIPAHLSYKNKREFSSELDQNAFMKLMLEQLKHQDPMSPMDNSQFIQQTSMMTMVEKLTRMASLMEESNSSLLSVRQYEDLIGKTASYEKETMDELTGEVTREQKEGVIQSVKMEKGRIYFQIGEDALIPRDKIDGIESKGPSGDNLMDNALKYAQMIGYRVTYLEKATNTDGSTADHEKNGVIQSVSMKNGLVELILEDNKKLKLSEIIGFEAPGT